MAWIPTGSLTPGMKLRRPLFNKNGVMALNENTELTEALIEKIRKMGIEAANVNGAAPAVLSMEEALAQLDRRFRNVEKAAHMDIIKKQLKEHIEGLYECHEPKNPDE